jgi:hypothetical protein
VRTDSSVFQNRYCASARNVMPNARKTTMRQLLSILFLTVSFTSQAQNLVINPSFEDTLQCPDWYGQIARCYSWDSYSRDCEYFNLCSPSTSNGVSVPSNFGGYQVAATGHAYAGFTSYGYLQNNYREYIGGNLMSPMTIGTKYYISFKVNLAVNSSNLNYATDKIGAKFSTVAYTAFVSPAPITNSAAIYTTSIISDTTNWTLIAGSFVADSAYTHIMIGTFFRDSLLNTMLMTSMGTPKWAYYYLDDICVSTDSLTCPQTVGTGIYQNLFRNDFKIYPNPTNLSATLEFNNQTIQNCTLTLYDLRGQLVQTIENITTDKVEIERQSLASGLYFFQLRTDRQIIATGKLTFE